MATTLHLPPELEAHVRALAEDTKREMQAVYEEILHDGLATARKRAFDRQLRENYEAGLRGDVVSEEESLARVGE